MSAARQPGIAGLLKRNQYLAIAVVVLLVLAVWFALPGARRAPIGSACRSNGECQSRICLPDADPAEVDSFVEIIKAYKLGRRANPTLVGRIEELLEKMPCSSLTLRPRYPGVCTKRCTSDPDCLPDMFCAEAVWVGVIKGSDLGRVQVCMPGKHPAARLMR